MDLEVHATLDIVVIDSPEWWSNSGGAEKCPDPEIVGDLYRRYLRLVKATRKQIEGDAFGEASGEGQSGAKA